MYYFIINPKSGTGEGLKVWHTVKSILDKRNITYNSYFTHYEFHATKITRQVCKRYSGVKKIVVLGGDGTVNEVINGILNYKGVLLGYIPCGSSNDLARSLRISKDPVVTLESILTSKCYRYYDHGFIEVEEHISKKDTQSLLPENGRKFSVSTGIGFDASICYEALNSHIKKILNKINLGKLTYGIIALKQLIQFKPTDAELIIDQHTKVKLKNIFFIASMIQPYEGGGFRMAPNANPRDHKLSICAIYNTPKLRALLLFPVLFFGKHTKFQGVKVFDCNSLEIHTKEKLIVHTDGEFAGRFDHIKIGCTKEQIRMLL